MKSFSFALVITLLILSLMSLFVVKEGQRGIVIQFGKVKRDEAQITVLYEPGLHFKFPLVESVKILDARIQTLDDDPVRFVTVEKKDLMVDSYIKWRIKDFAKYFLTTGASKIQAESLLKQKVNNGLRSAFGSRTISEIVSGERIELMEQAQAQAQGSAADLGIELVDVRVKQINLPKEVSNSIYNRMRAERHAVAKEHRSQGNEQAEILQANVDAKVTVMLAEAQRKSLTTRGNGDAQAAKIYADTFSKDSEFFTFVRSMEAYRNSFNGANDVMVLKPDSQFFDYMNNPSGKKASGK